MSVYQAAIQRPTAKSGYGTDNAHLNKGAVVHSMDGSVSAAFGELDRADRQASWHFSVTIGGVVYQHVDTAKIAWTNGSYNANKRFWGIECEGKAGDPIDGAQLDALVALLRWLFDAHGVGAPVRKQTLWEHREMTEFGSASTACPSGRVPWPMIIARLTAGREAAPAEEDDDMPNVFKMPGRPEQYHLVGGKLIHIPTQGYLDRLGKPSFVVVAKEDALWDSPVEYPKGVPASLRA